MENTAEGSGAPRRKKSAVRTREEILIAAGRRFARAGYATVRLRDIAEDVGITAPLVLRYFGSKEALFREVAEDEHGTTIDAADLGGPPETLGARLAEVMVGYWTSPEHDFPAIALIRSLDYEEAKSIFAREYSRRLIEPLAKVLPGPDAELRARLISAQIMGQGMFCLGALLDPDTPPPGDAELTRMTTLFGKALQACIDA